MPRSTRLIRGVPLPHFPRAGARASDRVSGFRNASASARDNRAYVALARRDRLPASTSGDPLGQAKCNAPPLSAQLCWRATSLAACPTPGCARGREGFNRGQVGDVSETRRGDRDRCADSRNPFPPRPWPAGV